MRSLAGLILLLCLAGCSHSSQVAQLESELGTAREVLERRRQEVAELPKLSAEVERLEKEADSLVAEWRRLRGKLGLPLDPEEAR